MIGLHCAVRMLTRNVATSVHGRFLYEARSSERLLVGFHGYAESAESSLAQLELIPGAEEWSLLAIQALHPFYTRSGDVVACWMTRLDRELAIADNLAYIDAVLSAVPAPELLVLAGFSQGAPMAARAAVHNSATAGLILLGGDLPPEIRSSDTVRLPPVLVGRGSRDEWYTAEKLQTDLAFLEPRTRVTRCLYAGGHEWTDAFRAAAGEFLTALKQGGPLHPQ